MEKALFFEELVVQFGLCRLLFTNVSAKINCCVVLEIRLGYPTTCDF